MLHEILPTDGPLTCAWKVLYGQDWMLLGDVMAAASKGGYTAQNIRKKMYQALPDMFERKEVKHPEKNRMQVFFRLRDGVPMPVNEVTRAMTKERAEAAAESTFDRSLIPAWLL